MLRGLDGSRLAWCLSALLAACTFDKASPIGADGGGPEIDAAVDGAIDDPCATWQTQAPFDPCDIPQDQRDTPWVLTEGGTYVLDTGAEVPTLQFNGSDRPLPPTFNLDGDILLVSTANLTVGADAVVRVIGSRPLLIAAWGTVDIENGGVIDVSSQTAGDGMIGAGGNFAGCPDPSQLDGGVDAEGGGGGGGGGFRTAGAKGGDGRGAGKGGDAGMAASAPDPAYPLRGGCSGGTGGPPAPGLHTAGGAGGGAIAIASRITLTVSGVIHAGGAGGAGGAVGAGGGGSGGGGGGSGGIVWLDSPNLNVGGFATLAANGGGGGKGGDDNQAGADGSDAATSTARAAGGTMGANDGGDGGRGGALVGGPTGGMKGGGAAGAGGGGGAATGVIQLSGDASPTIVAGSLISPDELVVPPP